MEIETSYDANFNGLIGKCFMDIYVSPVNDPPTITVASQNITVEEDDIANLNIEVDDIDSYEYEDGILTVSLSCNNGTMVCTLDNGVWVVDGGLNSNFVKLDGFANQMSNSIRTCKFKPDLDYYGMSTLNIDVSDNGYSGDGGIKIVS